MVDSIETMRKRIRTRVAERRGRMVSYTIAIVLIFSLACLATENARVRILELPAHPVHRDLHPTDVALAALNLPT